MSDRTQDTLTCANCDYEFDPNCEGQQSSIHGGWICDACFEAECDAEAAEREECGTDYDGSVLRFAGPGTALRAAGPDNPRNLPCPNCGCANRLTPKDRALGYQCDACADRAERGMDY